MGKQVYYYKNQKIIDQTILDTYQKIGRKHFVFIDGNYVEVQTSGQRFANRLFLNGQQITDESILATHENIDGKHYVTIGGERLLVETGNKRNHQRLLLNGKVIKDKELLNTYFTKDHKHFVIIDGHEVEVRTAQQCNNDRLFLNNEQITDKEILATHYLRNRKHYVKIDGKEVQVKTAHQLYDNAFILNGKELTDANILATYFTENRKHYVIIDDERVEICTKAQLAARKRRNTYQISDSASFENSSVADELLTLSSGLSSTESTRSSTENASPVSGEEFHLSDQSDDSFLIDQYINSELSAVDETPLWMLLLDAFKDDNFAPSHFFFDNAKGDQLDVTPLSNHNIGFGLGFFPSVGDKRKLGNEGLPSPKRMRFGCSGSE